MPQKSKNDKSSESFIRLQFTQQLHVQREPSPGFLLVAIGLVAYIFHAAKFFTFTWLYPFSKTLIIIGFVVLIIETLSKIKIRRR